jgi:hypothetical protein
MAYSEFRVKEWLKSWYGVTWGEIKSKHVSVISGATCVCVCVYICIYIYIYIYIYVYVCVYIHTHTHTYTLLLGVGWGCVNFEYKQKPVKTYSFRLDGCMCTKMGREMQTISHYCCQVIVVMSFVSCCFDMYSFAFTYPFSVQLWKESSGCSEWCAAVGPSIATQWNLNFTLLQLAFKLNIN